ncbi:MAG: NAD(P)/FAD-dependent oxidoreductase [Nakamurella sp.]
MTSPIAPFDDTPTPVASAGLVVIGGGPAGKAAALAYRESGGSGRVVLISAEDTLPYRRPPLSKGFLGGDVAEDEMLQRPASDYADRQIEVWLADPVTSLDTGERMVRTTSGREISYESVVLATGVAAVVPPIEGGDHPAVARLRSLDDARFLKTAAESAQRAVVIGSGFIGCEAAATLAGRGLAVTLVTAEELPQLARLGRAVAQRIAGWLTDAGVTIAASEPARSIDPDGSVRTDMSSHHGELVLAALGVTPNSAVAAAAGLELADGRIVVDSSMATAAPGVYAAGDVVFAENASAGRRLKVEHWNDAERMGQIAGRAAAGVADTWTDVPGFFSTIAGHTIKYRAWGDGYDGADVVEHDDGGFTVWYSTEGKTVGVLTNDADDDLERGAELIAQGAPPPAS